MYQNPCLLVVVLIYTNYVYIDSMNSPTSVAEPEIFLKGVYAKCIIVF